jgi:lipid II:glycine glycyltransferase (peptidoglycan interpeptide bridge formation enzyme)
MSIWQTKSWQEMLKKSGQVSEFFDVEWVFVEKRKVALWEFWLFILWIENKLNKEVVNKLIELCKKENCLFIQIETIDYSNNFNLNIKNFKEWYYKKFITPYTSIIDLHQKEEDILVKMKPKGRYNIKIAIKKWIEVKEVEKTEENIKKYFDLMLETTSRDNFNWNNLEYYKIFLNSLKNSKLLLAYAWDKVIAWWIFTFDDEISIYYYWASTSDKQYRNMMAPYLLQWTAIQIAKENWSELYDFLWVATPNDKNSELVWVTDFKLKLSKDIRKVSNSYIWINRWFKYNLILILKYFKKIIKK